MRTEITVSGVQQLYDTMDRIQRSELAWIRRQVQIAAINVQREARRACPVDSGRLRSSIQFKSYNGGDLYKIYSDADYSAYVEWGTGKYAYYGNGRKTPWTFYYARLGRFVVTSGRKPVLMMTKAWNKEYPDLLDRVKTFRGR